jgi:mycothiol synthase
VSSHSVGLAIRPFAESDYERLAEIVTTIDPSAPRSAAWYRHRDRTWNPSHWCLRLVAEQDRAVVGWGEISHMWWAYHPRKFMLRLNVDPAHQHHGIGKQLYTHLDEALRTQDPLLVRAETRDGRSVSLSFLEHRGFREVRRRWESRLELDRFQPDECESVIERLTQGGIRLATFAEESVRNGDQFLRDLFDLEMVANRDEPGFDLDASTAFDQFVSSELQSPEVLHDGSFVALHEQRLVGDSRLKRDPSRERVLHVGYTAVHPAYRGRGIAVALKVRAIGYARARGFAEIRTQNDSTNDAMLHINERLGFVKEPAWIVYEQTSAS